VLARERSVLPVRDFERLCEGDATTRASERVTDLDEQRAVLALLHDLGVVVAHGLRRDASAARREITVLDPNWLTGAIYTLINSPTVRDQGGELRHDQLGALLDACRYPPRWHELIPGTGLPAHRLACPVPQVGGPYLSVCGGSGRTGLSSFAPGEDHTVVRHQKPPRGAEAACAPSTIETLACPSGGSGEPRGRPDGQWLAP
jgi:hypothetical protein